MRMQVRSQSIDIVPSLSGSHFAQFEKEVDSAENYKVVENEFDWKSNCN